mgnify:CR=1 FL=1
MPPWITVDYESKKFGKKFNSPVCFSTMASTKMEETIKISNQKQVKYIIKKEQI